MGTLILSLTLCIGAFETTYPLMVPSIFRINSLTPNNYSTTPCLEFGIDYANPFGFSNLMESNIFLLYNSEHVNTGTQWHYFGISEYREDFINLHCSYSFSQWLLCGILLNDYIVSIHTNNNSSRKALYDYGLYCAIQPIEQISCLFIYNNIQNRLHNSEWIRPFSAIGLKLHFFKECTIEYSIVHDNDFTQFIWITGYITNYCSAVIGYSKELNLSSAGMSVSCGNILINYLFQHHTFLGNTHRFGIVYSSSGYNFTRHDKKYIPSLQKLNIQMCSLEELIHLDTIPENICERIIKYRRIYGPISIKSLHQLGLSPKQIKELQQLTYNYADEDADKDDNQHYPQRSNKKTTITYQNKQIKILFQAMIAAEIPAYIALSLSEEYQKNGIQGLLQSPLYKNLNANQQNAIKTACGIQ